MSKLRIVEINDPKEFIEKIQIDQNDNLYVYIEDVFSPIGDIYDKAIQTYEEYRCAFMFSDIQTVYDNQVGNQYFSDIQHNQQKRVIYSPIIARYAPINLNVYDNLEFHSFSLLQQASKNISLWHIPQIGFRTNLDKQQFQKLSEDSAWVLQQETL